MEGGLLSLKWNNHRSTFFDVLSTVRKKGSYCDVTIACDGKFYQVHKIVLATCSDYFEQIFERTNPVCKTPVIVLKDIKHEDLEALLNYMYVGEVNVLQTDLSGLIKAAECLRIKGLAVPDEPPSEQETYHDNKRNIGRSSDEPDTKRFRSEILPVSPRLNVGVSEKVVREREREPSRPHISYREPFREPPRVREHPPVPASPCTSPASKNTDTHLSNSGASESSPDGLRLTSKENLSLTQESQSKTSSHLNANAADTSEREMLLDDNAVKEEPHDEYSEADETKDSIRSLDSDPGLNYPHPAGEHSSGSISGESESTAFLRTTQPQTMEDLVAQVLPGTSGLQGNSWEGEHNLLGMPYEGYSGSQGRGAQMGPRARSSNPAQRNLLSQREILSHAAASQSLPYAHICPICGHLARQRKDLKKHLRIHTGEKPYVCPWCPYRSTQNSNLRTHIRRLHSQTPQAIEKLQAVTTQKRTGDTSHTLYTD